jgi:hypothetical protein
MIIIASPIPMLAIAILWIVPEKELASLLLILFDMK